MNEPIVARTRAPVFPIPLELPATRGQLTDSLHRQLRAAIVEARLPAGFVLPSSRGAAAALGIARNTVVAVYDLLIAEGYVLQGRGARPRVATLATRRQRESRANAAMHTRHLAEPWRSTAPESGARAESPKRSFRLGMPEHRHFPHAVWRRLMTRAWRDWSRQPFSYPPLAGVPELRAAIAEHIAFARAVACAAEDVIVTSGAQQSFDVLARALVRAGRTRVAIEEPGYPPLRQAFLAAGAELVPVPVDGDGLCVERVPTDVQILCVTPSHQSPTGVSLSMARRAALLEHARRHDALIIEDDYDGEFRYGGRPLDALQTLDREARVFYVGTFSKSLFPAIDTGFLVAPAWSRPALMAVRRIGTSHTPMPQQQALAAFIREGHLARHVRRMTPIYAARHAALEGGIRACLGHWLDVLPSCAGLHLAARVRGGVDARRLFEAAAVHLPGAMPTREYALNPEVELMLAIGFGVIDVEAIAPALAALAAALER